MSTKVLVTAERYEKDVESEGLILKTEGTVKEYQKVIAVGPMARNVKVGDLVLVNPSRYMKKRFDDNSLREDFVENPVVTIDIPTIELNKVPHFLIDENDIDFIVEDWEEEQKNTIIKPKAKIIL